MQLLSTALMLACLFNFCVMITKQDIIVECIDDCIYPKTLLLAFGPIKLARYSEVAFLKAAKILSLSFVCWPST